MAEFNTYHKHEETSQAALGEQEEYRRLREEIQQQVEAERATAAALERQQEQTRQKSMMSAWQRENARQRQSNQASQTVQSPVRRRAFGMDALLLCAVTMGAGIFLGPSIQGLTAHAPYSSGAPIGVPPMLTGPAYTFQNAVDQAGNDWGGSTMNITQDTAGPNGVHEVSGNFNWQADGNYAGSEEFSGTYDPATRTLEVEGGAISQPNPNAPVHLVDGKYTMQFGPDGKTIVSGYMEGIPGGTPAIPGTFEAAQP